MLNHVKQFNFACIDLIEPRLFIVVDIIAGPLFSHMKSESEHIQILDG